MQDRDAFSDFNIHKSTTMKMILPIDGFSNLKLEQPINPQDDSNSTVQAYDRSQLLPSDNGGTSTTNRNNRSDEEKQQRIKVKQQRLLLLHHSVKCTRDTNCTITKHCDEMKRLWRHMERCKDNRCDAAHCFSSRAILSHYRKCKDKNCPTCEPVRNTIRISKKSSMVSGTVRPQGMSIPSREFSHIIPSAPLRTSDITSYSTALSIAPGSTFNIGGYPSSQFTMPPPVSQSSHNSQYFVHSSSHEHQHAMQNQQQPTSDMGPQLKLKCTDILKGLQNHHHGWVFNSPVDPVELDLPDYFEKIMIPMDLGTVQTRLESGFYPSIDAFASDVNLTFDNATTYNKVGSVIYNMAKELKAKFFVDLRTM
jgi:E1A/CREB-binding protein